MNKRTKETLLLLSTMFVFVCYLMSILFLGFKPIAFVIVGYLLYRNADKVSKKLGWKKGMLLFFFEILVLIIMLSVLKSTLLIILLTSLFTIVYYSINGVENRLVRK